MHSLSSASAEITLFSLHPFYSYEISIAAVTIAPGPSSIPIVVRTDPNGKQNDMRNIVVIRLSVAVFIFQSHAHTNLLVVKGSEQSPTHMFVERCLHTSCSLLYPSKNCKD